MSDMIKFNSMDDARAFTLGINAIIAAAVAEERAAVVAWLRVEEYPCCRQCNGQLADSIERGEHRTQEEP